MISTIVTKDRTDVTLNETLFSGLEIPIWNKIDKVATN